MPPYESRQPILPGTAATDYERYLRTDELLALQKKPEQMSHPDELIFQVVHQSSELLLRGSFYDLERARVHITEGDLANAARLIRRANGMLDHPIELLRVLESFTPYDYHKIRAGLGHGSGLDSPGFLSLLHIAPRLGEAFFSRLESANLTVEEVYRHGFIGPSAPLHDVAERLVDFDERMQIFRFQHLKLAQRIVGPNVIGTGGLPMEMLQQRQEHFFYKPLWEARNTITAHVAEESKKEGSQRKG